MTWKTSTTRTCSRTSPKNKLLVARKQQHGTTPNWPWYQETTNASYNTMIARRSLLNNTHGAQRLLRGAIPRMQMQRPRLQTLQPTPLQFQQQQQRQVHFLPFLGLWGAKHLSAWTIYNASKAYGWPRVYRRLLEQNRLLNAANPALQKQTQELIRMAIAAPPKFAAQVGRHAEAVTQFLQRIAERAEPNLPRFLVAAIKFVVNSQKPVKILQDFAAAAAKK